MAMIDALEARALADYQAHLGRIVRIRRASYMLDDNSHDIAFEPPVRARIVATSPDMILHWNDEWLDPTWNVEPIDVPDALRLASSVWIHATSYSENDGHAEPGDIVAVEQEVPSPSPDGIAPLPPLPDADDAWL